MLALEPDSTTQEKLEKPGPNVEVMDDVSGTPPDSRLKLPPITICGSAPSGTPSPLESTQTIQFVPLCWIMQFTDVFCRMASNFAYLSMPASCEAVELSW